MLFSWFFLKIVCIPLLIILFRSHRATSNPAAGTRRQTFNSISAPATQSSIFNAHSQTLPSSSTPHPDRQSLPDISPITSTVQKELFYIKLFSFFIFFLSFFDNKDRYNFFPRKFFAQKIFLRPQFSPQLISRKRVLKITPNDRFFAKSGRFSKKNA